MTATALSPAVRRRRAADGLVLRVLLFHGLASWGAVRNAYVQRAGGQPGEWDAQQPWRSDGDPAWALDLDVGRWPPCSCSPFYQPYRRAFDWDALGDYLNDFDRILACPLRRRTEPTSRPSRPTRAPWRRPVRRAPGGARRLRSLRHVEMPDRFAALVDGFLASRTDDRARSAPTASE